MQRARRPNRQPRRGNSHGNSSSPHPGSNSSTPGQSRNPRPQRPRAEYTPVPSFASITVGRGVSIILKQDQPTGHQVRGIVAELLTRGDHPRGVKVRLRDGRVGRVQGLVSEEEGKTGEETAGGPEANLGRNGESSDSPARGRGGRRGGHNFRHVQDVRDDEYMWDDSKGRNLGEYFSNLDLEDREGSRGEESTGWMASEGHIAPTMKSETVKCPVCGDFEGDAEAVAHHVEKHFEDD